MTIESSFNNLITGKVFTNFKEMPYEGKKRVIIKTILAALAAGIIAGLIGGALPAVLIAGIVGLAAFSYTTTQYSVGEWVNDAARGAVRRVTYQRDLIDDLIDESSKLINKIKNKISSSNSFDFFESQLEKFHDMTRGFQRKIFKQSH